MIPRLPGRRGWTEPPAPGGKAVGMRTSSTWRIALALLLVLPLAGACKKKGPKPGEAGAGGAGLGEEGLGASGSSLERQKRGLPPEEDGILKDVHFAYDSYDLDGAARDALTRNLDWLRQNSRAKIELEGHCDSRGTIEYNLALGAKRSKAVKDYLVGQGIPAELVQQDHQLRTILQDQRKQLQEVQKEVERLRADIEEGHPRRSGGGGAGDDRLTALEQRLADLERGTGSGGLPPAATPPSGSPAPPSATASAPPAGSRPPAATPDDEWRQEIAREQKAAGTLN